MRSMLSLAAVLVLAVTACGSSNTPSGSTASAPPNANLAPPSSIGQGEGALTLIDWAGYVQSQWQTPFENQTGCKITYKDANTSDDMVNLMADGGGGNWDMVSSSGDADLRLIYAGDLRPVNVSLVSNWNDFQPIFKNPAFNTVNGVHYGISLQWGPNTLIYNTKKFPNKPTSWGVLYDQQYKGLISVPDNPIQIADAALYLSKTQPNLKITDPYELTQKQFDAAVNLLKQQRPLVKTYWGGTTDVETAFESGDIVLAAGWPIMTTDLKNANAPAAETIPSEGATGWADTWMMAAKAPHPNCAYKWLNWITSPLVQAEQAIGYGETPVNSKACAQMENLKPGSCSQFHADAPGSYFDTMKFWKTPIATCPDGSSNCIPYPQWQTAWTTIKG